jgi:hypothetical protein
MKSYPSIAASTGTAFREIPNAYIFDKLDGSNIRAEWSKKQGFYKFGTRTRLLDESDEVFGGVPKLWQEKMSEPLAKIATDQRWESAVFFAEFFGSGSFAGVHQPEDVKQLALIDVAPYKKGILGPRDFLKLFRGQVRTAEFLGQHNWTRGFVEQIRMGPLLNGITFEGVVGKAGEGHKLVMAKAKTLAWVEKVRLLYTAEEAEKIINS